MIVARHCARVSRQLCPRARAISTPMRPETRNRRLSAVSGGAEATMIRAEVKALDHITAKASPMMIARMSIRCLLKPKRAALAGRPFPKHRVFASSAVHAVLEGLCDGHLDDLIGLFLDLLTGGGVAHHALGALAAIDLADAG